MRLTNETVNTIAALTHRFFGEDANVWLFGSRVDDERRGGDIDLLIETNIQEPDQIVEAELKFLGELKQRIGDQRIDLLVDFPGRRSRPGVFRIARETGVRL